MSTRLILICIAIMLPLLFGALTADKIQPAPRLKYIPEDLVLVIPGKADSLKPFLVSDHLTTQKEYITYLLWLVMTHRDNPLIVAAALPADTSEWIGLLNVANENYPVRGLSNTQIMNYCVWRTDKLNEYILIQEKIIEEDQPDIGDHFFNLESYTLGFCIPSYREDVSVRKIRWSSKYEPDPPVSVVYADRYFFPNCRLPTVDELRYMARNYNALFLSEGKMNRYHSYYYDKLSRKWWEWNPLTQDPHYAVESYLRMFIGFDRKKYPVPPFKYQLYHNYHLNGLSPWSYYSERCLDHDAGKRSPWKNYSFFKTVDKLVSPDSVIKDSTGYLFAFDFMFMDESKGDPVIARYTSVQHALEKNMEFKPGGSVTDTSAAFLYNYPAGRAGFRVVMFAPDAVLTMQRK